MKNKHAILLLGSVLLLTGCNNNTSSKDSSLTEEENKQCAYGMISKAYKYLENYSGDFYRTNTFNMVEDETPMDSYEEEIIYDNGSKECLYQMKKSNDFLYKYFNKKDDNNNSYELFVNTSADNQKLKYKSTDNCIDHLMNIYDEPLVYTDYGDVLMDVEDFVPLRQISYCFESSNSKKPAFLMQDSYSDSLEYFKEYYTLVCSELIDKDQKLNDFTSSFDYEKEGDSTIVMFSGESSTLLEIEDMQADEAYVDIELCFAFELDKDNRFTSIERNASVAYKYLNDGQEVEDYKYSFELVNRETFKYSINNWVLNEDIEEYTTINEYPKSSLRVEVFCCMDGITYSSSGSLTNLIEDRIIDFDYLDKVIDIIPNQYYTIYRKEGTQIEEVYLNPECTKVFTGTDMKMGELTLYCTYDYKDNVCIATERFITDISAYNYKFGSEILFDERLQYSYESNFIDFSKEQRMCFDESMFEINSSSIGKVTLKDVTINDTTYGKEALLEGFTYNLTNRTVITNNYVLVY